MTRDQVVDRILRRLTRLGGDTDLVSDIVAELNLTQTHTLERGYPKYWFLLDIATITVGANGYNAPLPADFIELFEEFPSVLMVASDGSRLQLLEGADRSATEWGLTSPNANSSFSLMEGYLLFGTQLTVGTTIRILYYKSEPLNEVAYGGGSQPDPNRWLVYAADLLIARVGRIQAGFMTRDKDALANFDAEYGMALKRLAAENTSRKEGAVQRFLNGAVYSVPGAARTVTQTA